MVDHAIGPEQSCFTRMLTRDLFAVAISRSIVQGSGLGLMSQCRTLIMPYRVRQKKQSRKIVCSFLSNR